MNAPLNQHDAMSIGTARIQTPDGSTEERVWLLAGTRLLVLSPDDGTLQFTLDASGAASASAPLFQRYKAGFFEPTLMLEKSGAPHLALPVIGKSGTGLALGSIALHPGAIIRRIEELSTTDWIAALPNHEGIVVGGTKGLRSFREAQSLWSFAIPDHDFPHPPCDIQNWIVVHAERHLGASGASQSLITVLDPPSGGGGSARVIIREATAGAPMPGLPPLYVDGRLLIAIDGGRGDVKIISILI